MTHKSSSRELAISIPAKGLFLWSHICDLTWIPVNTQFDSQEVIGDCGRKESDHKVLLEQLETLLKLPEKLVLVWRIICIGTYHGGDLVQVTLNRLSRADGGGWLGCAQISMRVSLICFVAILL